MCYIYLLVFSFICSIFLKMYSFLFYAYGGFACLYVSALHVCQVPAEARRGCRIPICELHVVVNCSVGTKN